jgi:amidase
MATSDNGAFTERFRLEDDEKQQQQPQRPLKGLTVAIKDLYDVAGHRTGFGSPAWLATRGAQPATQHAAAVARLLSAGATLIGKTSMDELAYSLNGENHHYGTPLNPAAPARIPGGSSSGSASAVAQGVCDAALGSDTGGSVRVPSSYCGVYGHRPTHGRVPMEGARPLAASFDTGGWFARDAATLRRVGAALLTPSAAPSSPSSSSFFQPRPRWLVARDAFALASPAAARALYEPLAARIAAVSEVLGGPPQEVDLAPVLPQEEEDEEEGASSPSPPSSWRADLSSLAGWADVFRVAQAREIWREHGAWVEQVRAQHPSPPFGPGVDDRLRMAAAIPEADAERAARARRRVRRRLDALLGTDGLLVLPSAPGPAVKVATPPEQLDAWRRRLLSLTCVAGLAGLPQVSLPVGKAVAEDEEGEEEGAPLLPVGLSLIGPRGSDEALLEIAERLMAVLSDEGSPGGGGSS